jgi:hypothetical protein
MSEAYWEWRKWLETLDDEEFLSYAAEVEAGPPDKERFRDFDGERKRRGFAPAHSRNRGLGGWISILIGTLAIAVFLTDYYAQGKRLHCTFLTTDCVEHHDPFFTTPTTRPPNPQVPPAMPPPTREPPG